MKFSFDTFQSIWAQQGQEKAFAYRDKFKTPKTAPVAVETPKEDTIQAEVVVEAPIEEVETVETLSIEDMRKILDNNKIEYSHLAKEKGLMKKLEENKLI